MTAGLSEKGGKRKQHKRISLSLFGVQRKKKPATHSLPPWHPHHLQPSKPLPTPTPRGAVRPRSLPAGLLCSALCPKHPLWDCLRRTPIINRRGWGPSIHSTSRSRCLDLLSVRKLTLNTKESWKGDAQPEGMQKCAAGEEAACTPCQLQAKPTVQWVRLKQALVQPPTTLMEPLMCGEVLWLDGTVERNNGGWRRECGGTIHPRHMHRAQWVRHTARFSRVSDSCNTFSSPRSPCPAARGCAKSLWLCPTLFDPMDYSLPDPFVHGIS